MYPFCTLVAKCESDAEFMMMPSSLNKTFVELHRDMTFNLSSFSESVSLSC